MVMSRMVPLGLNCAGPPGITTFGGWVVTLTTTTGGTAAPVADVVPTMFASAAGEKDSETLPAISTPPLLTLTAALMGTGAGAVSSWDSTSLVSLSDAGRTSAPV